LNAGNVVKKEKQLRYRNTCTDVQEGNTCSTSSGFERWTTCNTSSKFSKSSL